MSNPVDRRMALTVLVSVAIHLILFSLLYLNKSTKHIPTQNDKQSIIQAQLIFVPLVAPAQQVAEQTETDHAAPEEPEPEPVPELQEPESKQIDEPPVQPLKTQELADAEDRPQQNLPPITQPVEAEQEAPVPEAKEQEEDQPQMADNSDDEPLFTPQAEQKPNPFEKVPASPYGQPIQDVVKDQLQSYRQNKLQDLAAQAAAEYRQQQTSPTLYSKQEDPFLTEDEKFEQQLTTTIDCSSVTNQPMSVVLGLLGGKVKCSEPPPFNSFIQKRLNKTAELPALQAKDGQQH